MSSSRRRTVRVARGVALFAIALGLLLVMDGSRQPTSGDGWRVLGMQRGLGHLATATAIDDQPALAAMFDALHLQSAPVVDFHQAAVFVFTGIGSIGCPARFEGMAIDRGAGLVKAEFARRLMFDCDASRVPDTFVVALDRARLPVGPFRVEVVPGAD